MLILEQKNVGFERGNMFSIKAQIDFKREEHNWY